MVVAALFAEWVLIKAEMKRSEIKRIGRIDGLYGVGAILVVLAGLALWLWVGKPAEFYNENGLIHVKLGLFTLVGLLSIIPTIFYLKNGKGDPEETVSIPVKIKILISVQLIILILMPFLASAMALGVKLF